MSQRCTVRYVPKYAASLASPQPHTNDGRGKVVEGAICHAKSTALQNNKKKKCSQVALARRSANKSCQETTRGIRICCCGSLGIQPSAVEQQIIIISISYSVHSQKQTSDGDASYGVTPFSQHPFQGRKQAGQSDKRPVEVASAGLNTLKEGVRGKKK